MTTLAAMPAQSVDVNGSILRSTGGPPTAGEILSMLRRRTVLIAGLSVFFCAIGMAGFLTWWFYFPGYLGESLIECISNIPVTSLSLEQQRMQQDEHERFVQSQALLIKSPSVLGESLKISAVKETNWYRTIHRPGRELLELTDDLSAGPVRGTNFLRVAIETHVPQDAPVIVNEVVNQWYQIVKKQIAEEFATDAIAGYQKELADTENRITEKRERLKDIVQRLPAGAKENPGNNITAQQVHQYGEQVAIAQLEVSSLDQYRQIYNDPEGVAVTAEDRAVVEQDPQVFELSRTLLYYQQQQAADEKVYGKGHLTWRQIGAQVAATEKRLNELRLQKLRERKADIRDAANTAYENSRHNLFLLQERLAKAEAELQDQDRLLFDYSEIDQRLQQDINLQIGLQNSIRNLQRVLTQRRAINVNISQPAVLPLIRNSPSLWLIPMIGVLSIALAMSVGLGLELIDTRVRTSQDIIRHLDVALLGAVPDTDDEEIPIEHVETAVRDLPHSMVAEAFRRIRTNLHFSAPAERQRSVVITSPQPEDGKTTVACNLAFATANAGKSVLLIDANLRRPALHNVFQSLGDNGLSNILVGEGTLGACVMKSNVPRLDVLGSGRIPPNPAELLGSPQWRALLAEAISRYDQVLIDSGPVLLTNESVLAATAADGVVLVIRAHRNSRGVARRACGLLSDVNAKMLGVVLNAARVTRGGYFREQLRHYYDYRPEDDALARKS